MSTLYDVLSNNIHLKWFCSFCLVVQQIIKMQPAILEDNKFTRVPIFTEYARFLNPNSEQSEESITKMKDWTSKV